MAHSKRKGDGFERKIAKVFADALGLEIRRTPLSGGWARGNPNVYGDLVCVDPGPEAFPYCVECKNEEGWRLESLFTFNHAWFDRWWHQLQNERPGNKVPLLVFSRAYAPIFVSFYYLGLRAFFLPDGKIQDVTPLSIAMGDDAYMEVYMDGAHVVIMELDVFMNRILPFSVGNENL